MSKKIVSLEDVTEEELRLLQDLKKRSITPEEAQKVLKNADKFYEKKNVVYNLETGTEFEFALIGDTHMGNHHYESSALKEFYRYCAKQGIKNIYHCGDLVDGLHVHPGQEFEQYALGFSEQVKDVVENYPHFKNVKTYFILGNHDLFFYKTAGANIGDLISKEREDMICLGRDEADILIGNGTKLRIAHPGGGSSYATCFDDKTEIMTRDGWKLFKDLNHTEEVATLNLKNNLFEWQLPTDYTDEEYSGELLHFNSRTVDIMVTPNHRMLLKRYGEEFIRLKELKYPTKSHRRLSFDWIFKEAKELKNTHCQEWQMKRGGQSWIGSLIPTITVPIREPKKFASNPIKHIGTLNIEDAAELIAWYVTEGYADNKRLCISQSQRINPLNHARIIDLFKRIGFNVKGHGRDNKDITLGSVELCEWLIKECDRGSRNKYLPLWLKNQPKEILEIVFDTMIEGDGWVNGSGFGYKSISKKLRQDMIEIATKLGYATSEYKDTVNITSIQIYPTINSKPTIQSYNGRIYCVSVPNTIILVRRNGKAIWTGNSYRLQKLIESISGGDKPNIYAAGHYHKSLQMTYRNVIGFLVGCFESQTDFMKSKGLSASVGGYIVRGKSGKHGGVKEITVTYIPFFKSN